MIRAATIGIFLCFLPCSLFAGELTLSPPAIVNGGVALLRWQGGPLSTAVARFNGRTFHLSPTPGGAAALVGADVQLEPGVYPLLAALVDRRGRTTFHRLQVTVENAERPVERLQLPAAMVSPRKPEVIERIRRERKMLDTLFATQSKAESLPRFVLPVSDPQGSLFGLRRILNGQPRSPHGGVDFRSPAGTAVRSPAPGRVAFSGDLYFTGETIIVDHGEGLFTVYAHLMERSVDQGMKIERGEVLGTVGSSGRATGPHLHWGSRLRGARVDPLALARTLAVESP